ncbi:MAG: hypothetical protein QW356_05530 [Candidatus Hadarchaeales archaeon]
MRTERPIYEAVELFRGRAGKSRTTRAYHLYLLAPKGEERIRVDSHEFVAFSERYLDARGREVPLTMVTAPSLSNCDGHSNI